MQIIINCENYFIWNHSSFIFLQYMSYCYTPFSCFVVAKTIVWLPPPPPLFSHVSSVFFMYVSQNVLHQVQQKQTHGHAVNCKWILSVHILSFYITWWLFCLSLLLELKLWKQYCTYNRLLRKIWSLWLLHMMDTGIGLHS